MVSPEPLTGARALLRFAGPSRMNIRQISLRSWIALVAGLAVVLAASIFAFDWARRMQKLRRYYLAEAARYDLDEKLSKEAWRGSLAYLQKMEVQTRETLGLIKKAVPDEDVLGKPGSEEDALLQLQIRNVQRDTENTRRSIINQTKRNIDFWFEDMAYNSFMKKRYLDAASHPWREAPAFQSKSSFLRTRKSGGEAK